MQRELVMLSWIALACAASACANSHRSAPSDFNLFESDVRAWQPGEVQPLPPDGATARCKDGKYSFAQEKRAACAHHGGVEKWLEAS